MSSSDPSDLPEPDGPGRRLGPSRPLDLLRRGRLDGKRPIEHVIDTLKEVIERSIGT